MKLRTFFLLLAGLPVSALAGTDIPEAIKAPAGHVPFLQVHAKGEQIYLCGHEQGRYEWKTQAPDARLYDKDGNVVGKHFKGPVWEYKQGVQVQGKVLARYDAAPGSAITWLLVEVVASKGKGVFAGTSYINRINTQGGLPPNKGCDSNHLGSEKRVNYSADYVFYFPVQAETP